MKSHTYYDILGVPRDATIEEITNAKNSLAKVYHPDANVHKDIDTTASMQEILEAYRVLSDPEKRKAYNHEMFGEAAPRVFRTFKVGPDDDSKDESSSFVTYWNAASRLNETLRQSMRLMEKESQKKTLSQRVFRMLRKSSEESPDEYRSRQIAKLSMDAVQYMTTLKMAGIPMQYWHSDAMNWVLIRWGQKQDTDYHILFSRYAAYVEKNKSSSEKLKLRSYNRQFHNNLKKLLSYSLEA